MAFCSRPSRNIAIVSIPNETAIIGIPLVFAQHECVEQLDILIDRAFRINMDKQADVLLIQT